MYDDSVGSSAVTSGRTAGSVASRPVHAHRRTVACVAAMLVLGFAGCSSTPKTGEQPGAAVENRDIGTQASKPSQPKEPLVEKPVGQPPISSTALTPDAAQSGALPAVLSDPKSLLSRRSVYFEYDSNAVPDEYRPMIQAHARFLLDNPKFRVTIQGNTDERGSREYNLALGQRRADAVRQAMTVLGVGERQMEPVSLGEERPRATGSDEASYAENRRADIVYDGEDKPPVGK